MMTLFLRVIYWYIAKILVPRKRKIVLIQCLVKGNDEQIQSVDIGCWIQLLACHSLWRK